MALVVPDEPGIDVETTLYPESTPYPPGPGERLAWFSQGREQFFGMETSRSLECTAVARDPDITGFRMELFRIDPEGPTLVARTDLLPAIGRHSFMYSIRGDAIGQEFLLRVTFHRKDGTTEVQDKSIGVLDPEQSLVR